MIKKTMVARVHGIEKLDTIQFNGALWLVPSWLDNLNTGKTKLGLLIGGRAVNFQPYQDGYYLQS